jgi:glutathione S-transferase
MILLATPTSPFSRTVRVLAMERALPLVVRWVSPLDDDDELLSANPIGKVPALVVDGEEAGCDSRSICARLCTRPRTYADLRHEALAHGLMEAALAVVLSQRGLATLPEPWVARQRVRLNRVVEALADEAPEERDSVGAVALGCALAYLDFRLPDLAWAEAAPTLAAWQRQQTQRPSMQATRFGESQTIDAR